MAAPVTAHVSERALVMLLPTTIYIRTGVAAVALTVLFLIFARPALFRAAFARLSWPVAAPPLTIPVSLISTGFLAYLIWQGLSGTRDPLENPLPVLIWSLWWILLPPIQALIGDLWHTLNPWRGLVRVLPSAQIPLPARWSCWPAVVSFIAFAAFMTADPAPDDPARLATILGLYWTATLILCLIFGEAWLQRGEGISVIMTLLARLAPVAKGKIGLWGHQLVGASPLDWSRCCLLIAALGTGSFDGLNETFAWLAMIGVNPLEFPGRSAVMWHSIGGLVVAILALGLVLAACIALGLKAAPIKGFSPVFRSLVPTLVPIAIGYHIAHYLTSFLVGSQYSALVISRAFGGPEFYVTTGFFNTPGTIRVIWLSQASAIVIAHMLAVLISHAIALHLMGSHRKAVLSQLPVAAFMVAYTFFGLWILAQPTGA